MKLASGLRALALAAATVAVAPAHADTVSTAMNGGWQKVGSSGATLDIQNPSSGPVQITTSASAPASNAAGQVLAPGERRCYVLASDLYALGAAPLQVIVTTNTGCASAGGGGGGGGGGSVTQGTSPWVDNITMWGGSAVLSGTGASGAGAPRVTLSTDSTVGLTGSLPGFATTPTVNLGTLGGAATAARQPGFGTAGSPSADVMTMQFPTGTVLAVSWSGQTVGVTGSVSITGTPTVSVGNFPATQPVSGTFWQAVQPVSGSVTATLGASTAQIGALLDGQSGTCSFTALGQTCNIDAVNGQGIDFQEILAGTGVTVTITGSNDPANATTPGSGVFLAAYGTQSNGNALGQTGFTGLGALNFSNEYRYYKLTSTAYGSGTATVAWVLRAHPMPQKYVGQGSGGTSAWAAAEAGSTSSSIGVTPATTGATNATALIVKSSAGNLYRVTATNFSTTAQYLALVNVAAAPSAGGAIVPLYCIPLPAAAAANTAPSVMVDSNFAPGPPPYFGTGITALLTTSCTTYTAGAAGLITALYR